jgi:hypothetical protein
LSSNIEIRYENYRLKIFEYWRNEKKNHFSNFQKTQIDYLFAKLMQITRAKKVAPSISAAAIIIEVRIAPAASGCLPEASIADAASFPIPNPAPNTDNPAPIPAARYPSPKLILSIESFLQ